MSDHRNTPESVLAPVRRMGRIITDPCSNATSIVDAENEYIGGQFTNGLELPWIGLTFVNGPWSNLKPWANRALFLHTFAPEKQEIFFWGPAYTETQWAKLLWQAKPIVCFWGKRVHHPDPEKPGKTGSMWPTMMVYLGHRQDEFARVFAEHGTIMKVL